jgi:hypothetical protein
MPVVPTLTPEANKIIDNLVAFPRDARPTTTRKVLKNILLGTEGWIMAHGLQYDIRSEHIGAGVYRLRLEERK